jgi:hypothetical protein
MSNMSAAFGNVFCTIFLYDHMDNVMIILRSSLQRWHFAVRLREIGRERGTMSNWIARRTFSRDVCARKIFVKNRTYYEFNCTRKWVIRRWFRERIQTFQYVFIVVKKLVEKLQFLKKKKNNKPTKYSVKISYVERCHQELWWIHNMFFSKL